MKEEVLIKFLMIIGLVCLVTIIVSQVYISNSLGKTIPKILPGLICQKVEGEYVLAKPTSIEACGNISDIPRVERVEFCKFYEGDSKTACLELINILQERRKDCLLILLKKEKTTVNPADVEKYCQILESQ